MYIIKIAAEENGGRSPLQMWDEFTAPEGYAICPDEFYDIFYSTDPAGFVNITIDDNVVTSMEVNQQAYDAYIEYLNSLPEPEEPVDPIVELNNKVSDLSDQLAETDEAAIELYEANLALEQANADQDEAIIEIYEMMGEITNG